MYLPLWPLGISSTSGLISGSVTSILDSAGTADFNPRPHLECYWIIKKEQFKKINLLECKSFGLRSKKKSYIQVTTNKGFFLQFTFMTFTWILFLMCSNVSSLKNLDLLFRIQELKRNFNFNETNFQLQPFLTNAIKLDLTRIAGFLPGRQLCVDSRKTEVK